uniref:Transposase n=1 Tax=Ditylenchus dipsaci TaxID=166011 RepID=A0A915E1H9_9BILA
MEIFERYYRSGDPKDLRSFFRLSPQRFWIHLLACFKNGQPADGLISLDAHIYFRMSGYEPLRRCNARYGFLHVIGALDGKLIARTRPDKSDELYWCLKGFIASAARSL